MATTKLYLDMRGKASDGKGSVVISLYHNSSQTSISTGLRFSPSEWKNGNGATPELLAKKAELDKAIALLSFDEEFSSMTASQIKDRIQKKKQPRQVNHPIEDIFNDYISSNSLKPKTKLLYDLTLKRINSFQPCMMLENIDLKWLKRFDAYISQTQKTNGKSVYLRCLRAVMNHARDNDIICPYPFSKFQIKHSETEKRSISIEELRRFHTFPVKNPRLEVYRDYFFLMFYLIGINAKDLLLAKKSQVCSGRLEYIREKTGKKYSIKIEPEAWEIILRYSGRGDYLLDAMDHCKHYNSFAREINEGLRLIGPENTDQGSLQTVNPLIPNITTYYARHTWATLAYEAGVPIDIISQALGHSMGNRTTLIYVKPNREKVDEANRKVIDLLLHPDNLNIPYGSVIRNL